MQGTPDAVLNANGDVVELFFHRREKYWEKDSKGNYHHPPNRMPKRMAWRSLRAVENKPGMVDVTYMFREKGKANGERYDFDVCKEVWACCLAKWTGFSIDTLVGYVADYMEHPGKMESEMFTYTYEDWKDMMEKDADWERKVMSGRHRYVMSLSTFDRYAGKYAVAGFDKEKLTFDVEDDVSCYAAYHRATPTYINSILGTVPMWQQMEYFKERWGCEQSEQTPTRERSELRGWGCEQSEQTPTRERSELRGW